MTSQKFLLGTIVGAVVFFVLGFVVYAVLLSSFFAANSSVPVPETPVFWALILGQIGFGALLTVVIGIAGAPGIANGLRIGLVVGFLAVVGFDFSFYATMPFFNLRATVTDIAVFSILSGIAGAAIGAAISTRAAA